MYDYDAIVRGLVTDRPGPVYYSRVDRNRVEYATEAMAALVTAGGYYVTIVTKTDWTRDVNVANWPTRENIMRYLNNVKKIQSQFTAVPGVILPVTIYDIDYIGANNIEKFLAGIPALVDKMKSKYRRCNTFNCGT